MKNTKDRLESLWQIFGMRRNVSKGKRARGYEMFPCVRTPFTLSYPLLQLVRVRLEGFGPC